MRRAPVLEVEPRRLPAGTDPLAVRLRWDSGNEEPATVYVSHDGGDEEVVARGAAGDVELGWVGSGRYRFRLCAGGTGSRTLRTVTRSRSPERPRRRSRRQRAGPLEPGALAYRCNICGEVVGGSLEEMRREEPGSCWCGATPRERSVVHALSMELFGASLAIADFPERHDLVGIGLSDAAVYADRLAAKLSYTNTFYERSPRLDVTTRDRAREGNADFVIASEVLEHVVPPVVAALRNIRRLLKPDGFLLLTVPYAEAGETIEHYPRLHDYSLVRDGSRLLLRNVDPDGRVENFPDVVLHGGDGLTVEMRLFSRPGLERSLRRAGFSRVTFHDRPYFPFGVYWSGWSSVPLAASAGTARPSLP
jgi:SAM-dependent methyltransferase